MNDTINKDAVAERIRVLRATKKISQTEIAEKLGIRYGTLSTIERGRQFPTLPQIAALSDFYGVSIDYLVKGGKNENSTRVDA